MTVLLTENLPLLAGAPNGIKKLRELILELALLGKLVPQDPNDEPASELLKRIAEEKARLISEGKIRKQKPLAESGEEAEPFQLPAGWKWSSLAQVAFVNPRNAAADSLEVSFVPMTFIGTRFDDQHAQEPRLWGEVKQGFTHFAEGDIGVAKITPCFENSKACVFSNLANGLGAGTTELHIVRPVSGTLDPRYVLAYLKSPQFLLVGETKMTGTAGQKRLPKDFVEANPFPLPPLSEQHRIVAKVDELMALCDRLETLQAGDDSAHAQLVQALLDSLTQARDVEDFAQSWQRLAEHFHTLFISESSIDALKQTLLQLAVMGKLVPQDPSEDTLRASLDRRQERSTKVRRGIPESVSIGEWIKAFPAPNSWGKISTAQLLRAGALIDVKDGNHGANHPVKGDWSDDGLPFITAAQVNNLDVDYSGAKKLSGDPLKRLRVGFSEPGDVIYTHKGSVGRTAVNSQPCVLSPQTTYYRPDSDLIFNRYLMYFFQCAFFTRQVDEVKNQTTRDFVPITQQYLFFILVPPLAEQHRIVAKVDQLMTLCDQLKARLSQARQVHEQLANALVEQAVA